MQNLKFTSGMAALLSVAAASGANFKGIDLTPIGTYASGVYESGSAEIAAYDPATRRLFVVNAAAVSVDVLDISDPTAPAKIGGISLVPVGGAANSVAVHDGTVAIAVEGFDKTQPGSLLLFDSNLDLLAGVTVGAQPDMAKFSPNGRWLMTANEGEPNGYGPGTVDPLGSVSIVDLSAGAANVTQANVRTLDFIAFNSGVPAGIRIFGPGSTIAQDLEPEYIAVSHDSKTAWVTLQENNALAIIDIASGAISLTPLGLKDHSIAGNGLDASDRDNAAGNAGKINITTWPIHGMYLPDGIASYEYRGNTFLALANEGDAREWPGFVEEIRIADAAYILDPTTFPNAAALKQNRNLGRLRATKANGDIDGDGDYDVIHTFGARSFSIRDATGALVFDSGDQFEQALAQIYPANFNATHDSNALDSRSSSKGPEPEGVVLGKAFGRTYAFIGLERIGGVMVYDITNPFDVQFVNYANNRNFANPFAFATAGDLGPEGLVFIKAEDSPTGSPLLVTANEISGTTTIYAITRE
jgi:DNA-binding beta-propeller fold protein YncE